MIVRLHRIGEKCRHVDHGDHLEHDEPLSGAASLSVHVHGQRGAEPCPPDQGEGSDEPGDVEQIG